MSKGLIFDIDHFAVHDGNGIRTTVFLKGCPLSCIWCHSPESQEVKKEVLFLLSRCTGCGACIKACRNGLQQISPEGKRSYKREGCSSCGECVKVCPSNALVMCGREMSSGEVVDEAAQDAVFYRNSGGGVTLTGGEVLSQPVFALEILKGLKQHGIHTIVETSGMGGWNHLCAMVPFTDLFYYDVKLTDPIRHKEFTGVTNAVISDNLRKLANETDNIVIRVPLITGYNDREPDIYAIYQLAVDNGIGHVQLLPYNYSAAAKYEWLGRPYLPGVLERQTKEYIERLKSNAPKGVDVGVAY